ncbi:glutaredoxin 3 [Folsomia candida]|nr:glutaredoxin 3 [Folsomia candida]
MDSQVGDVKDFQSKEEIDKFFGKFPKRAILLFDEIWSQEGESTQQLIREVISDLKLSDEVGLGYVLAEQLPEVSQLYGITAVPTTILFHVNKEVFRVTGRRFRDLKDKLLSGGNLDNVSLPVTEAAQVVDLDERIKILLAQAPVMLFMKGTPSEPQCGFSRTIVGLLNETEVPYSTFNILADNEIREGLKVYSNWRTYPQLYIRGELIGGLDIVKELKESGDLMDTLKGN